MKTQAEIELELRGAVVERDLCRAEQCPCGCNADDLTVLEQKCRVLEWVLEDPKPRPEDMTGGMP